MKLLGALFCLLMTVPTAPAQPSAGAVVAPASIDTIWNGIDARKQKVIEANLEQSFPDHGYHVWIPLLMAGKEVEKANQLMLADFSTRKDSYTFNDVDGYTRTWYMFNNKSGQFPGRMTPEVEKALLNKMWDFLQKGDDIRRAKALDKDSILLDGTENQDIAWNSSFFLFSQILQGFPEYRDIKLKDGSTVAENFPAWENYYRQFFKTRLQKAISLEANSPTYLKYTLSAVFNMRDFAAVPDIRQEAEKYLDVFYTVRLAESVNGEVGGARVRSYKDQYSENGDDFRVLSYVMFNNDAEAYESGEKTFNVHRSSLVPFFSDYKVPKALIAVALEKEKQGNYDVKVIQPGLAGIYPSELLARTYPIVFPSYSVRETFVTPYNVLGGMTVDASREYVGINKQNRWMGVTMVNDAGDVKRLFASVPGKKHGGMSSNDDINGVVNGQVLLVTRLPKCEGGNLRIFFPKELYDVAFAKEGWMFTRDPNGETYIAIKPSKGKLCDWEATTHGLSVHPDAKWLNFTEQNIPIIIQTGLKSDYRSYDDFVADVLGRTFRWTSNDAAFEYDCGKYGLLKWPMTPGVPPQIKGVPYELNPKDLVQSPFIESEFGSGKYQIKAPDGHVFVVDGSKYERNYKANEYGRLWPPLD